MPSLKSSLKSLSSLSTVSSSTASGARESWPGRWTVETEHEQTCTSLSCAKTPSLTRPDFPPCPRLPSCQPRFLKTSTLLLRTGRCAQPNLPLPRLIPKSSRRSSFNHPQFGCSRHLRSQSRVNSHHHPHQLRFQVPLTSTWAQHPANEPMNLCPFPVLIPAP